jgi:hypothetical protein
MQAPKQRQPLLDPERGATVREAACLRAHEERPHWSLACIWAEVL